MPYRFSKGFLPFVLLSIIMSVNVGADNPSIYMRNDHYQMHLSINNAYYLDADGDGLEDDVIAEFTVFTSKSYSKYFYYYSDRYYNFDTEWDNDRWSDSYEWDNDHEYYEYSDNDGCGYNDYNYNWNNDYEYEINVKYNFRLKLPSGLHFDHEFDRVITTTETAYQLVMLDHAIESGFYDLYVTINVNQGGWMKGTAWLTFDPPGGHGGDPMAMLY